MVDLFELDTHNIIRVASKHNDSNNFHGTVALDSRVHFLTANSLSTQDEFFAWFIKSGPQECKKNGGWFSPIAKLKTTLHELARLPVSYDKLSGDRLEVWAEHGSSAGNMLATRFLSALKSTQ